MKQSPFVHRRDPSRMFFAFDMFGTLVVNTQGTVLPVFEALCSYYPGTDPKEVYRIYREQEAAFKATHRSMELPIDSVVANLDAVLGCETDTEGMEDRLLRGTHLFAAAAGSASTLSYLKDLGYTIGVLSNTRYHEPVIRRILEDSGLIGYIDEVVTSADIGYRKPRAEAYRAIVDRLGTVPGDCYFCGDSLSRDYYGPLSVRFKGAVHIDPSMSSTATWKVPSIGDVPGLFEHRGRSAPPSSLHPGPLPLCYQDVEEERTADQ